MKDLKGELLFQKWELKYGWVNLKGTAKEKSRKQKIFSKFKATLGWTLLTQRKIMYMQDPMVKM